MNNPEKRRHPDSIRSQLALLGFGVVLLLTGCYGLTPEPVIAAGEKPPAQQVELVPPISPPLPTPELQPLPTQPQVVMTTPTKTTSQEISLNETDNVNPDKISASDTNEMRKRLGFFGPNVPVTKEEVTSIQARLVGVSAIPELTPFVVNPDTFLIDPKAGQALTKLLTAAKNEGGIIIMVNSAFRDWWMQQYAYAKVGRNPRIVLPPGETQHHSGLAVDFQTSTVAPGPQFKDTPASQWLREHAWKYGFIRPYKEQCSLDGIDGTHEPHHYLYVGREIAEQFRKFEASGTCDWQAFFASLRLPPTLEELTDPQTNPN